MLRICCELLDLPLASSGKEPELQSELLSLHSALIHYVGVKAHKLTGEPLATWWCAEAEAEGEAEISEDGDGGDLEQELASPQSPLDALYAQKGAAAPLTDFANDDDGGGSDARLAGIKCSSMRTLVLRLVAAVDLGTWTLQRRAAASLGSIALRAREPTRMALYSVLKSMGGELGNRRGCSSSAAVADVVAPFVNVLDLIYAELTREASGLTTNKDARWEALRKCAKSCSSFVNTPNL